MDDIMKGGAYLLLMIFALLVWLHIPILIGSTAIVLVGLWAPGAVSTSLSTTALVVFAASCIMLFRDEK